MSNQDAFLQTIQSGYHSDLPSICLGTAMLDGQAVAGANINVVLKSFNRHGLIAGATGTGKTKSIQLLAELLSAEGVSSLVMDIKGDMSGLAAAGVSNDKIQQRQQVIGIDYQPQAFPVEMLTLSDEPGVRLRATIEEFGPVLFSQMLELNDTQTGVITILFKYCDDNDLPLIDLTDLKRVLNFAMNEGEAAVSKEYGMISASTVGTILRKCVELEQQGADAFFGEPSFVVDDLMQYDSEGKGKISILRLTDMQDKPKLFSTFMLGLLSEVYRQFPEVGDADKPKLVIFIDEAHLLFNNATKALLDKIESIIKLIRSKAVGVFFCTQLPSDIPAEVLSQCGMKIQHALRAFTAKDRKAIKLAAENYPLTDFYETADLLTSLGIGEAAITALDAKGRPTPLAATLMQAPRSRMGILSEPELAACVAQSALVKRYATAINRRSAHEILDEKIQVLQAANAGTESTPQAQSNKPTWWEKISRNTLIRRIANTAMREAIRGVLSALGIKGGRRK